LRAFDRRTVLPSSRTVCARIGHLPEINFLYCSRIDNSRSVVNPTRSTRTTSGRVDFPCQPVGSPVRSGRQFGRVASSVDPHDFPSVASSPSVVVVVVVRRSTHSPVPSVASSPTDPHDFPSVGSTRTTSGRVDPLPRPTDGSLGLIIRSVSTLVELA
jgi:hypothetical protein